MNHDLAALAEAQGATQDTAIAKYPLNGQYLASVIMRDALAGELDYPSTPEEQEAQTAAKRQEAVGSTGFYGRARVAT